MKMGTEATFDFARFDALVRKVLSVPHSEIMRRESEYREQSKANPNRRGPKRKRTVNNEKREEEI